MVKDSLGDRMKHNYEEVSKTKLVHRMPVIIRLDGVAFHTFVKGFEKPFDEFLIKAMQETMRYLCSRIQGCVLGYTQSDEITLVLQDYSALDMQPWYDNEVQKLCSVSAAMATLRFNQAFNEYCWSDANGDINICPDPYDQVSMAHAKASYKGAIFDARCFNVPKEEVTNCIYWRQKDAQRNSINSLAQSLFSHKQLQGINLANTLEKMKLEKSVDWNELPSYKKWGSCCIKDLEDKWFIDKDIPMFVGEDRKYIEELINFN